MKVLQLEPQAATQAAPAAPCCRYPYLDYDHSSMACVLHRAVASVESAGFVRMP